MDVVLRRILKRTRVCHLSIQIEENIQQRSLQINQFPSFLWGEVCDTPTLARPFTLAVGKGSGYSRLRLHLCYDEFPPNLK